MRAILWLVTAATAACSGGIGSDDVPVDVDAAVCTSGAFTDAGQCIIASPPTDPPGPVVIVDGGPSCVGVECDAAVGE